MDEINDKVDALSNSGDIRKVVTLSSDEAQKNWEIHLVCPFDNPKCGLMTVDIIDFHGSSQLLTSLHNVCVEGYCAEVFQTYITFAGNGTPVLVQVSNNLLITAGVGDVTGESVTITTVGPNWRGKVDFGVIIPNGATVNSFTHTVT